MVLGTRRVNRLWYIVLVGALLFLEFVLSETYVDKFAVHIPGGKRIVEEIAQKHGCINLGQIGMLEDHYLFHHPHVSKRSSEKSHHHLRLSEDSQVVWVEQQTLLSRKKRDFLPAPAGVINEENDIAERRRRAPTGRSDGSKTYTKEMNFNDDLYNKMWYFHGGGFNHTDMNVMGAWKKGVTGKDVVISILDDGIEKNHDDLKDNYDPYASYDVNSHDADPMPRYDYTNENRHGTRCAGEVSAKANNTKCIVGIAYDSRIGGVRMLDGDVYDAVEATSLSFNRSHIDIYSASWGPDDDGRVVDGPGPLAKKAFIDGIRMGRKGLGSIFVWASGNGGNQHDSCNCDGYANSIYTLSISSISQQGLKPWYLEECASTLATTYSSGKYSEKQVITVDLHNRCTDTHTGTSASAPLAAGIVALILEVKPDLTWRDVQYITLMTSRYMPDGDWVTNGVGRRVSLRYGYGLMDATAMVELAEKWTNVPEQHICEVFSSVQKIDIPDDGYEEMLDTNACAETPRAVKYLEHVQAKLTIKSKRRGNLIIHLTSPMGTRSTILPQRPSDSDRMKGFDSWPFLSVHFWGENPVGRWKLEIEVKQNSNSYVGGRYTGSSQTTNDLISWSLVLHGTEENPVNLNTVTVPMPIPTGTAGPCYSECVDTCSGPSATQCDQCKNFRMPDSGACVSACPAGYYGKLGICRPCEPSCAMCTKVSSSEVMCLQCKAGFLLVEGKGVCRQFCEKGYYEEPEGSTTLAPVEERSDIECLSDVISIFLPMEILATERNVTWRDENCLISFNGSHFVDTIGLRDCGTTVQLNNDSVVFENEVIVHTGDAGTDVNSGLITHGEDYETVIPVKCVYPRKTNVTTSYVPIKQNVRFFEKRYGELEVCMEQYETGDYSKLINSFPRKIPLDNDIFIKLGLAVTASNIGLRADNCIATSTPSPADVNWFQLIQSGCPVDAVRIQSEPGSRDVRFTFKAFDFNHNATGFVYIHCEVSVCSISDPHCTTGCPARTRRSASYHSNGGSHLVSTGPLLVTKNNSEKASIPMATVFAIASLSVAIVAVVVAVIGWTRSLRKTPNEAI